MLDWVLVLCSITCIFGALCVYEKKVDVIVNIAGTISLYFIIYVLVSAFLFSLNCFSITGCSIVTGLISCIGSVALIAKKGLKTIKEIDICFNIREVWLSYAVILSIAVVTAGWFGYFGMGQDQGVYQVEAINLLHGNTEWKNGIEENDLPPEGDYRQYYLNQYWIWAGHDSIIHAVDMQIPGVKIDDQENETIGMWHGIPTYPSILALSARLFGIQNMPLIQAVFFVCFLLIIEALLRNMKTTVLMRAALVGLLGLSPQIIWIKKSTLTEMFLALLIALYLFLILNADEKKRWYSVVPLVGFCFFHVSVFTMMPIWLLIYWYLYCKSWKIQYIISAFILIGAYLLGFFMMYRIQPQYTLVNYANGLSFVPLKFMLALVVFACIIAGVVTLILKKKIKEIKCDFEKVIKICALCVSIAAVVFLLINILLDISQREFSLLTIVCYAVLSGIVLMPYILIRLLLYDYKIHDDNMSVLLLLFLWCILIYALLMRRSIPYYYYYGRYLAPFISIIILLFAYFVKNKSKFMCILPFVGIALLMPYIKVVVTNQDDTIFQWDIVVDLMEEVEQIEGAKAVFVDTDLGRGLFWPMASMEDVVAYPLEDGTLTEVLELLDLDGKHVIYISDDILGLDNTVTDIRFYKNNYPREDDTQCYSDLLGLPTDFAGRRAHAVLIYDITCCK